jgi:hypothetical protein
LPNCPVAYPSGFSSSAMVGSSGCSPIGEPGTPTLLSPVRKTLCPVMNEERPAVQLCSPYESVNRMPSRAMRSMLGVR